MNRDVEKAVHKRIKGKAIKITDPAGRETWCLHDREAGRIAGELCSSVCHVYREALKNGIYPYRYIRNREVISAAEQLKLAESHVAVIGAGGLGGHVILLLARLGIGHLVVADHDSFEESNLNRQALCDTDSVGRNKSTVAADRVAAINPGVEVTAFQGRVDASNVCKILSDCDVVVDALDSIGDRFILEAGAKHVGIPMIHGALAGFEGRIMTVFPDDPGLRLLYGNGETKQPPGETPEAVLGAPAVTPSVIASFQSMEVLKILLDRGNILRNVMIHVDLQKGQLENFSFLIDDQKRHRE